MADAVIQTLPMHTSGGGGLGITKQNRKSKTGNEDGKPSIDRAKKQLTDSSQAGAPSSEQNLKTTKQAQSLTDKRPAPEQASYSKQYHKPAITHGGRDMSDVDMADIDGQSDPLSESDDPVPTAAEEAERQGFLEEGQSNAVKASIQGRDIGEQDKTRIKRLYGPHLRKFQASWRPIHQSSRERHLMALRKLSQKIRSEFPRKSGESLPVYLEKIRRYDQVEDLILCIESLYPRISTLDEHAWPYPTDEITPDICKFLRIALDLELDWKIMVTERCTNVARQVWLHIEEGPLKDIYWQAFRRAEEYQQEATKEVDGLIEELRGAHDPDTRRSIHEQLVLARQNLGEKNVANGHHQQDHLIPPEIFEPAARGEKLAHDIFQAYDLARKFMRGEDLDIEEGDPLAEQVKGLVWESCRGSTADEDTAPAPELSEQSNIDLPTPVLYTSAGLTEPSSFTHNTTDIEDKWDSSGVPGPPSGMKETELGIVEHVRKCGGRNAGFRVILNVGTGNKPFYEVMPGSELGRGLASRWHKETPKPLLQTRMATHV